MLGGLQETRSAIAAVAGLGGAEGAVAAVAGLEWVPGGRCRGWGAERGGGWQLGREAVCQEGGRAVESLGWEVSRQGVA